MVERKDLLHLSFYKKSPYFGSDGRLRYMIKKEDSPGGEPSKGGEASILVTIWPGPLSYDSTPREEMSSESFPFAEESLDEIAEWISKKSQELRS